MRRARFVAAALAASPLAGQQVASPQPPNPPERSAADIRTFSGVPVPVHPRPARAGPLRTVDVPQAAKDAGHHGTAIYTATVGADGQLVGLTLKRSSLSPAIDAAVEAEARLLEYTTATDEDGKPIQSTVDVAGRYARHDNESPGGGMETYTCGDLVREWDWFIATSAARQKPFWPADAYVLVKTFFAEGMGPAASPEAINAAREMRERMWAKLIRRCRKTPTRLMLEQVDQPQAYVDVVNLM